MKEREQKKTDTPAGFLVQTRVGKISISDGVGIIEIDKKVLEPADIEQHISFLLGISQQSGDVTMPVLLDIGELEWVGWKARVCSVELLRPEWNSKVAFYYHNPVQKVLAAFFAGVNKPLMPWLITGDRTAAMRWLREPDDAIPPPAEKEQPPRIGRLEAAADVLFHIGLGDYATRPEFSAKLDELDAVSCGLSMIAEELGTSSREREQLEAESRRHRLRLERLVEERTAEVREMNESLKKEIADRQAAEEALRRINRELDNFAYTVSHDLKGPIAVIQSASDTLLMSLKQTGEEVPHAVELAQIITRNTVKATELIENVLALSRAGQVPADISEVSVRDIIDRIIEERSAEIAEKGVTFEMADDLGTVLADPTHIYQIFSNLIANVIQHNDSETPSCEVRVLPSGGQRRFLVRDNGSGIPGEDLKRVFEPFFSGTGGRTGIGLSTVERLVKVYSGEITAFNDDGACFEFSIGEFILLTE